MAITDNELEHVIQVGETVVNILHVADVMTTALIKLFFSSPNSLLYRTPFVFACLSIGLCHPCPMLPASACRMLCLFLTLDLSLGRGHFISFLGGKPS